MGSAINGVGEGEDGVAAAVSRHEGRVLEGEDDVLSADVELRGVGHTHAGGAGDGGLAVCGFGEVFRSDGIDKGPVLGVAGAVGVGVVEGYGALSVGSHINDGVVGIRDGRDFASAGIV